MYSPSQQTACRFWRSIGLIRTNDDAVLEMFVIINSTSTHWSLINHSNGVSGVILFSRRVGPVWNNPPACLIGSRRERFNTFVLVAAACYTRRVTGRMPAKLIEVKPLTWTPASKKIPVCMNKQRITEPSPLCWLNNNMLDLMQWNERMIPIVSATYCCLFIDISTSP